MLEGDNKDFKSLYVNYNLSTGQLHHDENEVKSLQSLCILSAVINAFESFEVIQEMKRQYFSQSPQNYNNLLEIVKEKVGVKSLPRCFTKDIELTIHFLCKEIESFLSSFIVFRFSGFFLGNLVFNCQGTINPRLTILKALSYNTYDLPTNFEFSCLYSFDRYLIEDYFNDLPPGFQLHYSNPQVFSVPEVLIFYWVTKILREPQESPEAVPHRFDHEIISSSFFHFYLKSYFCTVIGVQYLFENLTPPNFIVLQAIRNILREEPESYRSYRFNILMYLILQLQDNSIFIEYSYQILINLITNPIWQDIFIRYFKVLKNYVPEDMYIQLTKIVVTEMRYLIKMDGKYGKYFTILKDYVTRIPELMVRHIERTQNRQYANLVFLLTGYEDIELINPLLSTEKDVDIGDKFYELAKSYPDLFTSAYCLVSEKDESFLMKVVKSEKKLLDLLSKLYSASLDYLPLSEIPKRFKDWKVNLYTIPGLKLHSFTLRNDEFVKNLLMASNLKALIKIEYAEQFLSIIIRDNQLLISFKGKFVVKWFVLHKKQL